MKNLEKLFYFLILAKVKHNKWIVLNLWGNFVRWKKLKKLLFKKNK